MMQKLALCLIISYVVYSINIAAVSADSDSGGTEAATILKEIEGQIKKGEDIYYDDIIINGDLDFSSINLSQETIFDGESNNRSSKAVFPIEIAITNSKIDGILTCQDIYFLKPVNFGGTSFTKGAYFDGSDFYGDFDVSNAKFKGVASLSDTAFDGNFNCNNATFSSADFEKSKFNSSPDFTKARFNDVYFTGAIFSGAYFFESTFAGDTEFTDAQFYGNTIFMESKFNGNAFFDDSIFHDSVNFFRSVFNGPAFFTNATFMGNVMLDKARFNDEVFFDNAKFDKMASLSLEKTHYGKLYAKWQNIADSLIHNDETYLSLIKNYKDLGWFEDANDCYYSYRCNYRESNYEEDMPKTSELNESVGHYLSQWPPYIKKSSLWTADSIFMSLNGYGVNPFWPLYWMMAFILILGIFYWLVDKTPFFAALKFSTIVLLSGSGKLFVQAPDYKPNLKNSPRLAAFSTVVFYFGRIMGMIIFVSFLIAFGRTVLR
jgi:uncharacterized protein YjbI with pentapeptide repeats